MISVQVTRDGFSFNNGCARSEWLSADRLFSCRELQQRYDDVTVSVFTPKFTLVPTGFFRPENARALLGEAVTISDEDVVGYASVPQIGAVAIFSTSVPGSLSRVIHETVRRTDGSKGNLVPEQYCLLQSLEDIKDYNKVVASFADGHLYLVVAQGRTLLLCNSFEASDLTTAEYFIFMVLGKFQMNPEMTTIYFRTPLEPSDEAALYNYFQGVEVL